MKRAVQVFEGDGVDRKALDILEQLNMPTIQLVIYTIRQGSYEEHYGTPQELYKPLLALGMSQGMMTKIAKAHASRLVNEATDKAIQTKPGYVTILQTDLKDIMVSVYRAKR